MIKKLQIKFILLSMTVLLIVLAVIISAINIVNYRGVVREADSILSVLSENKGTFPMDDKEKKEKELPPGMSPEIPYESRYFSVLLDADSNDVIQVETSRITSVDASEAIDYAEIVTGGGKEAGFAGDYRYKIRTGNGTIQIVFLDCGRKLSSFRYFLFASAGISVLGYLIVFAVIAFFSNKIIRPISESYEKQKRFITDAGHEIKTPLTIIKADADVLEMEFGENEWLEDIQKQAKRLTTLTNDLVYLARMEESSDSLQMIEFPVSDVVGETAASFQTLAQTQNKTFRCDIQPMLSMKGNEKSICQLVSILLDNAMKYSPEQSIVSLSLIKQNKVLLLSVFNTTQNLVSNEDVSLLFERFYRTDPSRSSQTGGYGIGLSVAKAIVTAHKGKIQAKTEDGHSLRINVQLPI